MALMRVLDLFSGIGGFSLGLERSGGFQTVAFCEIEPFCRRVLAKHWPNVRCYEDVKTLTADRLRDDGLVPIDVICGGFPCQDISTAGTGAGIDGERSGLWSEYSRLIGELRPRFVLVENVAALLSRGLGRVLGDLAALGYDAEWHCIPASAVGATHRRDRIWIIAHSAGIRRVSGRSQCAPKGPWLDGKAFVADSDGERKPQPKGSIAPIRGRTCNSGIDVADTGRAGLQTPERGAILSSRRWHEGRTIAECGWWSAEPDVGRVAHGIPSRVDRLRSLGNAVVPQIPEIIGCAILASEGRAVPQPQNAA